MSASSTHSCGTHAQKLNELLQACPLPFDDLSCGTGNELVTVGNCTQTAVALNYALRESRGPLGKNEDIACVLNLFHDPTSCETTVESLNSLIEEFEVCNVFNSTLMISFSFFFFEFHFFMIVAW